MTMVAGCKFKEGVVLIADSRVTYYWPDRPGMKFSDTVQKILSLTNRVVIGYAGDIPFVASLVGDLQLQIKRQRKLHAPHSIAQQIEKSAPYFQKQFEKKRAVSPSSLILVGVSHSGKTYMWSFDSPDYKLNEVAEFDVIGSGEPVKDFIEEKYKEYDETRQTLKEKADLLSVGIEGALTALSKEIQGTVGGMLQVLLIDENGIAPLSRGYIDINPERPTTSMRMDWERGKWVQKDLIKGNETPLDTPDKISPVSHDHRVQNYEVEPSKEPRWFLGHFLICSKQEHNPADISFGGLATGIGSMDYPASINFLAPVCFWGTMGKHKLKIILKKDKEDQVLFKEEVEVPFPVEELELTPELVMNVEKEGVGFVECFVNDQLLARRPVVFTKILPAPKELEDAPDRQQKLQEEHILQKIGQSVDIELEQAGEIHLAYFSLCREATMEGGSLSFMGQVKTVYAKEYPVALTCNIAVGVRATKGLHRLTVDILSAITGEGVELANVELEMASSFQISDSIGRITLPISNPGYYYVRLFVDGKFITSNIIFAENTRPMYSYSLLDEDMERVKAGELLVLPIRAQQKP